MSLRLKVMEPNEIIGSNIRCIREHLGYTQDEVAGFLGVSRAFISLVENGEREIGIDHLEKITDLFNVQLIDLLEENQDFQKMNYAFAFRANNLTSTDLNSIADFQKVVKSYLKMKHLSNEQV